MIRDRSELDATQRFMAAKIIAWSYILLAAPMGIGKTASVLTAIVDLFDRAAIRRALVVAPLRVATDTWPTEIKAWRHTRCLSFNVISGEQSPIQREFEVGLDVDVTIVNRENFLWLYETIARRGVVWPYDLIVYDESSSLRGFVHYIIKKERAKGKKQQLTRFGALAKVQPYVKYMIELSGTPASNGLIDLGGQAFILDGGERLGRTKTAFEKRWFAADYMGWNLEPREFAEQQIMDRMRDIMVSIESPPFENDTPVFIDVPVRLGDRLMKEYKRFKRTLVAESYDVEAVNSGVLVGKLLQFANGAMYQEKRLVEVETSRGEYEMAWERKVVPVHRLKLDALESVVEEAAGNPILIAYSFHFDRDAIMKRYPKARLIAKEKNGIKDWNAGKVRIAVVHAQEIGHGTNIQFGGHLLCWFGVPWSKEVYDQLNARLPRRGQKYQVRIYRIIALGTDDERVLSVLSERGATQERISSAVRISVRDMERELAA